MPIDRLFSGCPFLLP